MLAAPTVKFFRSRPNIPTLLSPLAIRYVTCAFQDKFSSRTTPKYLNSLTLANLQLIGYPATNCNRRYLNGFRLRELSLTTYQKSQKIPAGEVAIKRDLLRGSESSFIAAWERD